MNGQTVFDATNKIWHGAGAESFPNFDSKKSLGSWVLGALERFPDKIGQASFRSDCLF